MPDLSTLFYNALPRRNSIFVSSIFVGAFGFSLLFDVGTGRFWDYWNKGKQWKDIRAKYAEPAEE